MRRDVSIIICTRDRSSSLRPTLESIGKMVIPEGWNVELLVVDNGSTDFTAETVAAMHFPNLPTIYLWEPRKGKGFAYHAGMAAAQSDVLLFTDDDVRVPMNWVEGMCAPILEGTAQAVQGGIRLAPHLERPWLTGALRIWLAAVEDPACAPQGLVGANMAFDRRAADLAGGFDTRLGPGASGFFDDTQLGWQIERTGGRILYRPEISVEHHFSPDRLGLPALLSTAHKMAASRAIITEAKELKPFPSAVVELTRELPGFAVRCLTQLVRFLAERRPDAGFLVRYYRICLWWALRKRASQMGQVAVG